MAKTSHASDLWWSGEDVVALDGVPALLPPDAKGRHYSASTIYRWSTAGVCGVRLRRFRAAPGRMATTRQEVARFQAALTALSGEVDA